MSVLSMTGYSQFGGPGTQLAGLRLAGAGELAAAAAKQAGTQLAGLGLVQGGGSVAWLATVALTGAPSPVEPMPPLGRLRAGPPAGWWAVNVPHGQYATGAPRS